MTLQTTGAISLNDINVELRRAGDTPVTLNDALPRYLAGVPSGVITLADFYGKTYFTKTWSGDSHGTSGIQLGFVRGTDSWAFYQNGSLGPWSTINSDGTFTGNSMISNVGFEVSGALMRARGYYNSAATYGSWITFTVSSTSWDTVLSTANNGLSATAFQGSGGLLRGGNSLSGIWGAYQSLT